MLICPIEGTLLSVRSILGDLSFSQRPLEGTHALLFFNLKGTWGSLEILTEAETSFLGFTLFILSLKAELGSNMSIQAGIQAHGFESPLSFRRTHHCFLIKGGRKWDWSCSASSKKSKLGIPSCRSLFSLCLHKRQTTFNSISATQPWYSLSS